jgi:hypothetical protein
MTITQDAQSNTAFVHFTEEIFLAMTGYTLVTCHPANIRFERGWLHFLFRDQPVSVPAHKVSHIEWPKGFSIHGLSPESPTGAQTRTP